MTKSAGTQTTTTNSTPYNSSYLDDVFGKSQDLYSNNKVTYDPNQTLYQSPWEKAGYQGLIDNSVYGHTGQYTVPAGNQIFENAAYGNYGVTQSPSYQYGLDIANNKTAEQGRMADTSGALSTLGSGQGAYYDRLNSAVDNAVTGNTGTSYLTGTARGDYLGSNPGAGYYDDATSGSYLNSNPANRYFNQTASGAYLGADPSSQYWNKVSGGAYLNSNPYLDSMYGTAADQVVRKYQTATAPQADSAYEKAGRYGSGALTNSRSQNEQNLGTTLSGLASDIYGKNYSAERTLQSQDAANASRSYGLERGLMGTAASNLGSAYGAERTLQGDAARAADTAWGAERGLQYNSANSLGSQYNTATSNQLTGSNYGLEGQLSGYKASGALDASSLDARQKALNSLQTGYDQGNTTAVNALGQFRNVIAGNSDPWSSLIKGGEGLSSYGQAGVTDDVNRYYGNQEDDWYNLKNYAELIGQPISGESTTSQPLKSNWGSTALGGISSLASLAAAFSDERLKHDIEPIGELDNGLPIYQYRYNWEDGEVDPHVGLMAQDVALVHPDAVLKTPSGYLAVDYERAIRPRRR